MSATQRLHRIRIKRFSDIGLRDQAIGQLCADVAILERKNSSFSDDHDVLKGRKPGFVQSEKFAQQALDPVSLHRVPGFPADRHADSSGAHWVPACDDGEMRRVSPYALLIDPRIILSFPNTFMFAKGVGFHGVPPLSRGLADLPLARLPGSYRQSYSSFCSSPAENGPAAPRGHPDKEAVGAFSLGITECCQVFLHGSNPV
jgi:hypothetical protein